MPNHVKLASFPTSQPDFKPRCPALSSRTPMMNMPKASILVRGLQLQPGARKHKMHWILTTVSSQIHFPLFMKVNWEPRRAQVFGKGRNAKYVNQGMLNDMNFLKTLRCKKNVTSFATAFKYLNDDWCAGLPKEFEEICLQLSCRRQKDSSKTLQTTCPGRLNTIEIPSMSGPSVSRCFDVFEFGMLFVSYVFLHVSIHVPRHFPGWNLRVDWTLSPPGSSFNLSISLAITSSHCNLDQGVDADPAKNWGPWKHAVWRAEDNLSF